jgi:hypothetical protein
MTIWLVTIGLFALFGTPMTLATGALLVMVGLVVPTVAILLWKQPPPTVAELLTHAERSPTR